jgi:hypothetical protein
MYVYVPKRVSKRTSIKAGPAGDRYEATVNTAAINEWLRDDSRNRA